jgi:energy-coupling factor transport system substrate-specific component
MHSLARSRAVRLVGLPALAALGNVLLNDLNRSLESPLFFDSIFTAVTAALLGPWSGLVTALLSSAGMEVVVGLSGAPGTAFPFVGCEIATALVVAGAVKIGSFRTVADLVLVTVAVTLANAIVGSFTATLVFGGITLHGSDVLVTGLLLGGQKLLEAAFWVRIPLNLVDKSLAVGLAFWMYRLSQKTRG